MHIKISPAFSGTDFIFQYKHVSVCALYALFVFYFGFVTLCFVLSRGEYAFMDMALSQPPFAPHLR